MIIRQQLQPVCIICAVPILLVVLLLAGCGRGGEGQAVGPQVVLDIHTRMAGPINDAFYYFIPLDTDGDFGRDGPVPVAAGPYWQNGWGTGSFSHYVEYHLGQYNVFRVNLEPVLQTPGGGITAVSGSPVTTDSGIHTLTVNSLQYGAATISGTGMITAAANTGLQAAGTLSMQTTAEGRVVADSLSWTPAADGGRPLTAAEQTALDALNTGSVYLTSEALAALGLSLSLTPPAAGSQIMQIEPAIASVESRFVLTSTGEAITTTGELQANSRSSTNATLIPGVTLTTHDLTVGGQAVLALNLSPNATLLGPPFDYVLPAGGNSLQVTIDLAMLGDNIPDLSLNIITTNELIFDPTITDPNLHSYDGLGRMGNRYITFRTTQYQTITNSSGLFEQELANDPTLTGPTTQQERNSIDIIDWSVTIRRLR